MNYKLMIPSILSGLRLLFALIFPFVPQVWWIWLVVGSGASDFFDGQLARRWHVESWWGGLLDAIADKMFVLSALATFVLADKFSLWWVPAVLARDLTVAAVAAYAAGCRSWDSFRHMGARWSGKVATAGQFFMFVVVALCPMNTLPLVAVSVTAVCSVVAAVDYGLLFRKALAERRG